MFSNKATNCLHLGLDTTKCFECNSGYLVDETTRTCVVKESCNNGIIVDYFDIFNGIYYLGGKYVCSATLLVSDCKYYGANFY